MIREDRSEIRTFVILRKRNKSFLLFVTRTLETWLRRNTECEVRIIFLVSLNWCINCRLTAALGVDYASRFRFGSREVGPGKMTN